MQSERSVFVESPARLHLGLIDLRGDLPRRFGGTGAAVRAPSLRLEARPSADLRADGPEAGRVLAYARRFLAYHGIRAGATLRLRHTIPAHAGLGSGTQLALATARALAELNDLPSSAGALSAAVGRARRSAIGMWVFEHGGFILEGGRQPHGDAAGPLLLRHALPESWRCVLVIPHGIEGLSGDAEEHAFRTLPTPSAELVGEISRLVLMLLLPSVVEADLGGFGRAVTEIQRRVGDVFRAAQGSPFAHPLVAEAIDALLACGAAGAGQSSWGPTTYGFVDGEDAARHLASRLESRLREPAAIIPTAFDNTGGRCGSC